MCVKNSSKFEILIHKAWENPEFRKMLKEHPEKALFSLGIETPSGKKIKVYEDTETQIHISIPHAPPELSEEDLKKLSAGLSNEVKIALGIAAALATSAALVYANDKQIASWLINL